MRRIIRDGAGIFLGCAAMGALGWATAELTAILFERIVPVGHARSLIEICLVLTVVTASLHLLEFSVTFLRVRLQTRLVQSLRTSLMERLLGFPAEFFRSFPAGEVLSRAGLADGEQERVLGAALTVLYSGVLAAATLVVIFRFDGRLGSVSLAAGLFSWAVSFAIGLVKVKWARAILESSARLRSFLFQLFGGISKVRCAGAESWLFLRWSDEFHLKRSLELSSVRISHPDAVLNSVLPLASVGLFFWFLGKGEFSSARFSPGRYLAFFSTFTLFLGGALRSASAITELVSAYPLFERLRPLLSTFPEQGRGGRAPGTLTGRVELRELSFKYPSQTVFALENLNVVIEAGQFVALVGASGSGKSTMVRLLLGFEQPSGGEILYDDVPFSGLDVQEVRRQIGTVLQHDQLMAGNVYENIAAARAITLEQAWEAARIAGLERDLAQLPMGLHSFVTQGGRAFSGGERQRLMIARAVAGRPRILIFDEGTSALDNQVQAEVMRNLEALKVTRIVVAHRLSTVQRADRILVLDRGRVVESGDFATLLAQNGHFARLARRQSI